MTDAESYKSDSNNKQFLTLDTVRGMLKSLPPCSLKPQGAGPLRFTEYTFIALRREKEEIIQGSPEQVFDLLHPSRRAAGGRQSFPTQTHMFRIEIDSEIVFFQSVLYNLFFQKFCFRDSHVSLINVINLQDHWHTTFLQGTRGDNHHRKYLGFMVPRYIILNN